MLYNKTKNPACDPKTSMKLVSKGRIVRGEEYIEELVQKYKLNYKPAHQIWEGGQFEIQACVMLGKEARDLYIGCGKANYKYNNSYYPTVGLWVNAAGNYGVFWFASSEAKKLFKKQREEYQKFLQSVEKKIREGNFTWSSEYRMSDGSSKSSSSDHWRKDYVIKDGVVEKVFSSRSGYDSMSVEHDIDPSGSVTDSWKEDPVGEPLKEDELDFECYFGTLHSNFYGSSGNGVRWASLVKELYPEIKIPEVLR